MTHTIKIDEEQRQGILLALAHLTVERPGWELFLTETASKLDEVADGKPRLYTELLKLRRLRVSNSLPEEPTDETFKIATGCHISSKPTTELAGATNAVG